MTEQDKLQYIRYMQMRDELENEAYKGVHLLLDGEQTSPHSIASACVFNEDSDYMRDYIRDSYGHISELSFDRINQKLP